MTLTEEETQIMEELTEAITKIAEKHEISYASLKLILHEIAENLNPYISIEELQQQ
jgi:hypothetical protein